MSVVERSDELLRLLRRRGDWRVDDLAAELEVSRRTVLRDVSRLRNRGFDISSMSGPGGGVQLRGSSVMLTSRLDADEVVALILSVAVSRAVSSVPFAESADRALAKLEAALPQARVAELQRFMTRVLIGDPAPEPAPPRPTLDPGLVTAFETALATNRLLAFAYRDRHGRRTHRRIEPHGLLIRIPLWYMIAWDPRRDGPRLFRADRARRPRVTEQNFIPRPHELVVRVCPDARPIPDAHR
jgi:predicted DNA-binding transcriptional regulator YafY